MLWSSFEWCYGEVIFLLYFLLFLLLLCLLWLLLILLFLIIIKDLLSFLSMDLLISMSTIFSICLLLPRNKLKKWKIFIKMEEFKNLMILCLLEPLMLSMLIYKWVRIHLNWNGKKSQQLKEWAWYNKKVQCLNQKYNKSQE